MSLIDQAITDLQAIMQNGNEFATPVTFAKPGGVDPVTVNAMTNKIMVDSDGNGNTVVTERTTVAVHENTLLAAGYTVRNANGEVAMTSDLVTTTVFGEECNYIVKYQIPDQKLGCLVFVLEKYTA
jgi:hypothetical protein